MGLWYHLSHPIFSSSILLSLAGNEVQPLRARALKSHCQASVSVLTLTETLGKLIKSSMPQFPQLYNGKNESTYFKGLA